MLFCGSFCVYVVRVSLCVCASLSRGTVFVCDACAPSSSTPSMDKHKAPSRSVGQMRSRINLCVCVCVCEREREGERERERETDRKRLRVCCPFASSQE